MAKAPSDLPVPRDPRITLKPAIAGESVSVFSGTRKGEAMKTIKKLGLGGLAALMAMACVGAGAAMASSTALCKADENPCASVNALTHVHALSPPEGKATVLTSIFDIECDLLYLSETIGKLGSPLVLSGQFTYSNCNNNCTITEESGPGELILLRIGHETASLQLEWLMHLVCGVFLNCRFNGEGLEGIAKGSLLPFTEGEVFEEQELNRESGFCPEIAALDFLVLSLSNLYIVS